MDEQQQQPEGPWPPFGQGPITLAWQFRRFLDPSMGTLVLLDLATPLGVLTYWLDAPSLERFLADGRQAIGGIIVPPSTGGF